MSEAEFIQFYILIMSIVFAGTFLSIRVYERYKRDPSPEPAVSVAGFSIIVGFIWPAAMFFAAVVGFAMLTTVVLEYVSDKLADRIATFLRVWIGRVK